MLVGSFRSSRMSRAASRREGPSFSALVARSMNCWTLHRPLQQHSWMPNKRRNAISSALDRRRKRSSMIGSGSAAINSRRRRSLVVTGLVAMGGSPGCGVEKKSPGPCRTRVKTDFNSRATSPIWRITQNLPRRATKSPGLCDRGWGGAVAYAGTYSVRIRPLAQRDETVIWWTRTAVADFRQEAPISLPQADMVPGPANGRAVQLVLDYLAGSAKTLISWAWT